MDKYDFGNGTFGPLIRKTLTTYLSPPGSWVSDKPSSVVVQDGAGNTVAQTNFSYDESTPTAPPGPTPQHTNPTAARLNLTTVSSLVSGTNYLAKHFTYYDTGMVQTATDVNGAITTYNYPDATSTCGNTFPTSVSLPLSLTTSSTWDCNGAVMTSSTDANGQTTSYAHNDSFWRVTSVTDALSNVTNTTCTPAGVSTPATQESALNFNSGLSTADMLTTFDSLGRSALVQKRQAPGASNFDTGSTFYDSDGRVSRVTMPCVKTAGQSCPTTPATTTTYDGAGRPLVTTDGGGGTLTLAYTQNDVQQTVGPAPNGENTKSKQLEYDGLGRLTSVCEITSASGSGNCAQSSAKTGFWTKYTYNTLGRLTGVSQNAQGAPQSRAYSYDSLGRLTSENNPETNTTQYFYDTAPSTPGTACPGTYNGDLVKKYDANGNTTCYTYDALHRASTVTYSGPNAGSTPTKTFVYDSTTFTCPTAPHVPGNVAGRLAEAYTGSSGSKTTDVAYCYSARGEITDVYESTAHSGGYYHTTAAYWANGVPQSLGGIGTQSAYTYGVDGEGRPKSATQGTTNFVSNTTYNAASQPLTVSLYNGNGDNDTYAYDSNTGRLSNYTFTIGSPAKSMAGALTWNPNGTLSQLAITDGFNSGGTQTCKYGDPSASVPGYDDLGRLLSANCASAWSQTFAYNDPFGNITKSGSISWAPGYNSKNQYTLGGTSYDSNGNLLNDTFHSYTWDADNHPAILTAPNGSITCGTTGVTCLTYDALGRMVEKNVSGTYSEIEYSPFGKAAVMNGTAQLQAYVPLPGGETLSPSPDTFWHTDWLGSVRLATSASQRTVTFDRAFAPFGEMYDNFGSSNQFDFAGLTRDTVSDEYDTPNRELHPNQARWISPDPAGLAAVNPVNPQSWNRYAYVVNYPLGLTDASGLGPCPDGRITPACTGAGLAAPDGRLAFPGGETCNLDGSQMPCDASFFNQIGIHSNLDLQQAAFSGAYDVPVWQKEPPDYAPCESCWYLTWQTVYPNIGLLQLVGRVDWNTPGIHAANNGQQPKSPARKQCEADAENEFQNTFDAFVKGFYPNAYKSGLKGVLWGGGIGCAVTWEIGCAEGGLPGAVIGGLAGAGKSEWEDMGSLGMAYLKKRNKKKACEAIP